jgi:hypothetical protein
VNGYRLRDNQSKSALKWLTGEEIRLNITIQHAGRGREYQVAGTGVDGFYIDKNGVKHIYQVILTNLLKFN